MKGRQEDAVATWILDRLETAMHRATVELRLRPQRTAESNPCPDFVIEVEVRLPLFTGRPLVVQVPVLVEVEAASGIEAALLDLERYVERSNDGSGRQAPAIQLPFVALTGVSGLAPRPLLRSLPVRFVALNLPWGR